MISFKTVVLAALAFYSAQEPNRLTVADQKLPDPPKPRRLTVNRALIASEVITRTFDVYSTHRMLSAPCRCNRELDPLAPKGANIPASIGFQAAMGTGVILASRYAQRSHHRWVRAAGRSLLVLDVADEVKAVQGNMSLPTGRVVRYGSTTVGKPVK